VKLKRIELQGFKSFVDRTVLDFDAGITAILGPNGCGKSNIVDAVRWVLGEQSAKTLRGGKMDDVIFKGTTKRKPIGMAEVTLTFSNDDHALPIEFEEVAVKRRVTRDGTSDYYLNGTLCRLKDLRDLFYDSGVNNTSYSIIEESMIKQILSDNNQELRKLLEEGSGITKYKARRKETQRKLDRTSQDLLRLNDIIEEIGSEVRSLRRQVGKARRHQKLRRQIRSLDVLVANKRRRGLDAEEHTLRDQLQELRTLAEVDTGELGELRSQIEQTRPALDEREAERRQLEEALQAFEEEVQETERQVLVLEHRRDEFRRRGETNRTGVAEAIRRRQDLGGQIERMAQHLATVETELQTTGGLLEQRGEALQLFEERVQSQRAALDEAVQLNLRFIEDDAVRKSFLRELQIRRENRQERLANLATEQAELEQSVAAAAVTHAASVTTRDELTAARGELLAGLAQHEREATDLEVTAATLQERLARRVAKREAASSRLELLRKIQAEYEGYGPGARAVLQAHGEEPRVLGGLAEQLQIPDEYTAAFETLLGGLVDAVVVDDATTALGLVQELREQKQGLASFLCVGTVKRPDDQLQPPRGGIPALDIVGSEVPEIPHLSRLLAATAVFPDDDTAASAALDHAGPWPAVCVSLTGLLVTSDGVVRGGHRQTEQTAEQASLLGRGEKIEQLAADVDDRQLQAERAQTKVTENQQRRESIRAELARGREELATLDERLGSTQIEIAQLENGRQAAERRQVDLTVEQTRLDTDLEAIAAEEGQAHDLLAESGRQREDSTTRRDDLRLSTEKTELERDETRAEVEELRLIHQRREGEKRECETALNHLRESVAELDARRERMQQEIELGERELITLDEEHTNGKQRLAESFAERERRRQILRGAAESIQALHQETAGWHDRVKNIEQQRSGYKDRSHEIETRLATLDLQRNNLEERIEQEYRGSFVDLVTAVDYDDLPRELERDEEVFSEEQADTLLATLRQKLEGLGPINHLALEEYDTKKERLDFLTGQRDDVEQAKDDLQKAVTEINRTARKLFATTFEEVRRNYVAVFQTLFRGGRADLRLIRTEDPLESDIHIVAQPSGKVIDHVSLLSGGERCLTALSILFAVYLVKPSPFCVLDEADAPLDDSNIQRFVRMLREFSTNTQFLVITHNKLTMETANHLYGVTMMEQGVSAIVSVTFGDVADSQSDRELGDAIARRRRRIERTESVREILADDQQTDSGMRFTIEPGEEVVGADADGSDADGSAADGSAADGSAAPLSTDVQPQRGMEAEQ